MRRITLATTALFTVAAFSSLAACSTESATPAPTTGWRWTRLLDGFGEGAVTSNTTPAPASTPPAMKPIVETRPRV